MLSIHFADRTMMRDPGSAVKGTCNTIAPRNERTEGGYSEPPSGVG